ncbi:MAG: LytR/AlgR family response regulator transcription factor [Gammaproteobacteria bacterium]
MIIDDEPLARKRVRDLLRDEPDIRIVGESGDGLDARKKTQALKPDILFLDIKMPGLSGLELSRLLRDDKAPCIIFTTAYAEHAVDAFSLDAVDYLMKPFDKQRFHEALTKARKRLAGSAPTINNLEHIVRQLSDLASERSGYSPERLAVKDGTHLKFLVLRDIIRMQSDGDYLHIHSVGGEHTMIRERMHIMQQRLGNMPFVRISRSALINFDQVKEIKPIPHGDYEFILKDRERLTSGKTYREAIRTRLGRMNGEKQQ